MDEFIIGVIVFSAIVLVISGGFVKWFDTLERKRALLGGSISGNISGNKRGISKTTVYLFIGIAIVANFLYQYYII